MESIQTKTEERINELIEQLSQDDHNDVAIKAYDRAITREIKFLESLNVRDYVKKSDVKLCDYKKAGGDFHDLEHCRQGSLHRRSGDGSTYLLVKPCPKCNGLGWLNNLEVK